MVWRVMIVALLIVDIAIAIFVWWARRWTPRLAVINVLVNIVGTAAFVILLLQGDLLVSDLPQQLAGVFDGNADWRVPAVLIADAVIVIAAWDSIDGICKARRGATIKAIDPVY